jgi:hypothetical protein
MQHYIPSEIQIPGLYEGINLILWWISAIISLIFSLLVLQLAKQNKETESVHALYNAYSFFFFALSLNRIFYILCYTTSYYDFFLGMGYFWVAVGFFVIILVVEKHIIDKLMKIPTILSGLIVLMTILGILFPQALETIRDLSQTLALAPGGFWFFLYLLIIKQTTGAPRRKAQLLLLGMIIAVAGYIMDSTMIYTYFTNNPLPFIPLYVVPNIHTIGVIFAGYIMIRKD